ncbi:hypothetical protein MKD41_01590 [Lutibacter sp. A64]|uniref:hypothetical protein n=1 Tax=Lutibacter sp. A64 TaxID=2918526 RepID=UPI001F0658A7|nr:hypothetical protein [Lutibacter sp. A64]UMB54183.1 hypothetical protein MKD41_01590 [Lutibacter sp. A64]
MIYLNYANLDLETQGRLLATSKKDIEHEFGKSIKAYAKKHFINYEQLLEEEALRNLYNYKYVFNI